MRSTTGHARSSTGGPRPKYSPNSYAHSSSPVLHRPVELAQYTSKEFAALCDRFGVTQSMGMVGTSADNSLAKSFNAALRREVLQNANVWPDEATCRRQVFHWVTRYNTRRRHSWCGHRSRTPTRPSTPLRWHPPRNPPPVSTIRGKAQSLGKDVSCRPVPWRQARFSLSYVPPSVPATGAPHYLVPVVSTVPISATEDLVVGFGSCPSEIVLVGVALDGRSIRSDSPQVCVSGWRSRCRCRRRRRGPRR
ncbi:hypothetical protein GON09_005510 [Rhodococcus sp. B50]|nr:hypothetical protein [Rhodococcus sp. B50]